MTTGPAEIFDLGYRGYEGERTSRWRRRLAIWRDGVRISLGLGRSAGAKFASWSLIALAVVPVVVLVVVSAFLSPAEEVEEDFELPSYPDYYEWASLPLGLFAAVVAPLLICPDRRDGVLSLYASRPITADRLRRLALGGLRSRVRRRGLGPGGGAVRLERAGRAEHRLLARRTTGTSSRGSSLPGPWSPCL